MLKLRLTFALICSLFALSTSANTLTILTWEAYFADETIAQWEARTGAQINQVHFDSDDVRNSILFTAEVNQIDLVTIDPVTAAIFSKQDTFLNIHQHESLPNLRHANAQWMQLCGPYTSPYLWGTLGLLYRQDKLASPPSSWRELLYPSPELQGHIGLLANYGDTLAPSLVLRNESASTNEEPLLQEVFAELKNLLPSVLSFDYSITYLNNNPMDEELHLALGYSGDDKVLNNITKQDNWDYIIPDEGSMMWGECLGILKNAPQAELALDFINFLNIPEIAARNSEAIGIATTNDAGFDLQSSAFRNDSTLQPNEEITQKLQHYSGEYSKKGVLLRNRIITTLEELHESQ